MQEASRLLASHALRAGTRMESAATRQRVLDDLQRSADQQKYAPRKGAQSRIFLPIYRWTLPEFRCNTSFCRWLISASGRCRQGGQWGKASPTHQASSERPSVLQLAPCDNQRERTSDGELIAGTARGTPASRPPTPDAVAFGRRSRRHPLLAGVWLGRTSLGVFLGEPCLVLGALAAQVREWGRAGRVLADFARQPL